MARGAGLAAALAPACTAKPAGFPLGWGAAFPLAFPFGEGPTTVANTCAPSVREWYRTWSPGENILGLKWQHNTPIQRLWRENITEHTQVLDL